MRVPATLLAVTTLAALAGCNDPSGTTLVVHDPTGTAKRLELYLSQRQCGDCETELLAKGATDKLEGNVMLLDTDVATDSATFDGNRASVVLHPRPGDAATHVKLVVAIAYDAADSVVGVAQFVPTRDITEDSVAFRIDLQPAEGGVPSEQRADPTRVSVWRATMGSSPCISLEDSTNGDHVERTWLVPDDDRDCDGLDNECDPYAWESEGAPDPVREELEFADCRTVSSVDANGNRTCQIGAYQGCQSDDEVDDPLNPTAVCTPFSEEVYCVPAAFCEPTLDCYDDPTSCISTTATQVACSMAVQGLNGGPCPTEVASYLHAGWINEDSASPSGLQTCIDAEISVIGGSFGREAIFQTDTDIHIKVEKDPGGIDCKFKFAHLAGAWAEGVVLNGFIKVELPDRHFVIAPLALERENAQCAEISSCSLILQAEDEGGFRNCLQ